MRARRVRHLDGFTLIEAVVAMTIFAVGILGVVVALSMSTRASISSLRQAEAARLAQNQMELAVHISKSGLGSFSGEERLFTWQLQYEQRSGDLYVARIVVQWQDRGVVKQFDLNQLFVLINDQAEAG